MSTAELTKEEEALFEKLQAKRNKLKQKKEEDYTASKHNYADNTVAAFVAKAANSEEFMKKQLYEAGCMWELMSEYGELKSGNQGFFEIYTKDKKYKIRYKNSTIRKFNDTVSIAVVKLRECIDEGILGGDGGVLSELGADVLNKKTGNIDMSILQRLYKYERKVNHSKFTDTMDLFREAYQEVGKASYLNVFKRNDNGGYDLLVVDPSRLR